MIVLICWKNGKTTENLQKTQIFPNLVSKEKNNVPSPLNYFISKTC